MSNQQDGEQTGVFARVFSSAGINLTNEFQVNTYFTSDQYYPSVNELNSTTFVVAWNSYGQDGGYYGVYAKIFSNKAQI
jgi:hypothetical protein